MGLITALANSTNQHKQPKSSSLSKSPFFLSIWTWCSSWSPGAVVWVTCTCAREAKCSNTSALVMTTVNHPASSNSVHVFVMSDLSYEMHGGKQKVETWHVGTAEIFHSGTSVLWFVEIWIARPSCNPSVTWIQPLIIVTRSPSVPCEPLISKLTQISPVSLPWRGFGSRRISGWI